MKKKTSAYTLLEIVITMSIIIIVSAFLYLKILNHNENMELITAKNLIETSYLKYINLSKYEKNRYSLTLNSSEKQITINNFQNNLIEDIKLPKKLKYSIPYEYILQNVFKTRTTTDGNLSKAFTIYIFGYNGEAKFRISFYTFQKEKILKINTYKNKNAKNINIHNLIQYHYSENSINRVGWELEK